MYHSVYLLNRALGSPSCGEVKQKRAIQEILSSLQERLQRQNPLPMPRCPWVWALCQHMRWPCGMFAIKSQKPLQVCRMIGNILGVDLGTEQEPGPGITVKLAPKMNGPILKTIARNPKIGGSALGYLKARIWQQRTRNLPSNCPLRT